MRIKPLNHVDILAAIKAYKSGDNVSDFLKKERKIASNTSEIIELAYDLQAGSYINHVRNNPKQACAYSAELAAIIGEHTSVDDTLLDVGSGE